MSKSKKRSIPEPHRGPVLRWIDRGTLKAEVLDQGNAVPILLADARRLDKKGAQTGTPVTYGIVSLKNGGDAAVIKSADVRPESLSPKKSKLRFGKGADRFPPTGIKNFSGGAPGLGKRR